MDFATSRFILDEMNRRRTLRVLVALGVLPGPVACHAKQKGRVWRVGYLTLGSPSPDSRNRAVFLDAMRDLGYVEGRNLIVEWRFAEGNFERLPSLAAELVQAKVDVIVAVASGAIRAAQAATTSIPIVMATTGDPVGSGFVQSLARPGGNITGLSNLGGDTGAKLLDLLLTILPKTPRVGVLVTPTSTTYRTIVESVQAGAQKAGVTPIVAEASSAQEIEGAFAMLAREEVGAVIVGAAPFFSLHRKLLAELALKHRMASIYASRGYVEVGGLLSYGTKIVDNYARAAVYVDKIFKGARPGDLPVEQPVALELVVNLRTARALGITIPRTILMRSDEVIE